jgi:hypothetical protein
MVGAEQPVDRGGLVLFDAADLRQRLAQRAVHARGHVRETVGLELEAVHEDDADAGERVIVELADRRLHELAPGEALAVDRAALDVVEAQGHCCSFLRSAVQGNSQSTCHRRVRIGACDAARRREIVAGSRSGRVFTMRDAEQV